jgi:uncharacterized membrane protein YkoI
MRIRFREPSYFTAVSCPVHTLRREQKGFMSREQKGGIMTRKLVLLVLGAVAVVAVTVGVAAPAVGGDDDDAALSGATLERASAAALEHTGGGTVVDSEQGDDGAAYGVEIRLADGSQVEVTLDSEFNVIGQETDDDSGEGADEDGRSSDD